MHNRPKVSIKWHKFGTIFMLLILVSSFFMLSPKPVQAQIDFNQAVNNILTPVWDWLKKAYEKGGAAAFQKTVRTALNKVAYDTATWLGSGGEGQKPMFVTQGWGDYLAQIGDEAAGQFIEEAVNNWNRSIQKDKSVDQCDVNFSDCIYTCADEEAEKLDDCNNNCLATYNTCINSANGGGTVLTGRDGVTSVQAVNTVAVCQPSSIDAKLKISLGLVDYNRPQAPNCSASELVANWSDAAERMVAFKSPDFLDNFSNIFNPVSNDLGIFASLRTDMTKKMETSTKISETKLIADGGFLDMQDIAGNLVGMPGDAETKKEISDQNYISNMATFSGDALIDAANVFLNQLALSAYSKFMSNLGKKATSNNNNSFTNASYDPNIRYGETAVKESAASIIEPDFGVRADYDILTSLSICRDHNNPGPTECVIDDKLMQAVTEKKTVAEAIQDGYLHKNWLFTADYRDTSYSLRNLEIMRKYRLIPVSWEVAAASNKDASLIDLVSCFSANDEYNEYSSNFNVNDQSWCRNLVDPNWVLKAPLNYCAKQGFSAQILDTSFITVGVEGQPDTIQITRADDYCADEQSCIQERADGSCEAYGYCQSERRTWNFDSNSCEPIDNTCSAFINVNSNQRIAYLENTLDYADCNADSVGCKRYSLFGLYDQVTSQVDWSENTRDNTYFNGNLSSCSSTDEACTEMIRVKPGWGLNLIMGADFVDDNIGDSLVDSQINNYWNIWSTGNKEARIIDSFELDTNSNGKALFITSRDNESPNKTIGVFSNNAMPLVPKNFNVLPDETYTLSADVYLQEGAQVSLVLGNDYVATVDTRDKNVWRHLSVTRNLKDKPLSEMSFLVIGASGSAETQVSFAVRNMKLEITSWDSGFSSYGNFKTYERVIPPYLEDTCYIDANSSSPDYRLRADAPAVCDNYARQCNQDEVGCESYQEANTGFKVAAQVVSSDYCDATCNGYDLYVAKESNFYSPYIEKLIPQNSTSCSAEAVGCSSFTNLDEVAAGGEGQEYYTQLKQCIKPGIDCADFYTWVGTEESGYQLKSLSLKKDVNGNPSVTSNDSALCNQEIFNLTPSDPKFNSDCRQFYNKAGNISYHLSANTITCSENCHAYRLTENNIDATITSSFYCRGANSWITKNNESSNSFWNTENNTCYVCKNGGIWSSQDQACIYQAIPDESKSCTFQQNGCREYNGSLGNNIQMLAAYSFEMGLDGWEGQCGDAAVSSQVVNVNNGHSLYYDRLATQTTECDSNASFAHIRRIIGASVTSGDAYNVKFTASASAATNVRLALMNGQGDISYFNVTERNSNGNFVVPGDNEWRSYELNLVSLDHEIDDNESLIIIADKDFYLDNMVLTAINDRYYLIKDSSTIPDVCFYDLLDNYQGPDYNLGCSLYYNRAGNSNYLRQFSKLCQDSAVGCELMISTANYNDYKSGIWQDTNNNGFCDSDENGCVEVAGDSFSYVIYDENKRCNSADLGCSRLGESSTGGNSFDWSDVFKKNNPNNYDRILCAADDAGCEAWQYVDGSGISYFKNPGSDACVYRISSDPTKQGKSWYKVPVKRCDLNDSGSIDGTEKNQSICATDNDCANNSQCLIDNNDYDCPTSYFKTFGFGGGGNQVPVPSESAALCSAASSGCSEYIDPVSAFSANLIIDPTLESFGGVWNGSPLKQTVTIQPNKLYILSIDNPSDLATISSDVELQLPVGVSILQEDNNLSASTYTSLIIPKTEPRKRIIFHSRTNTSAVISGAAKTYEVQLKEVILDYQFQQNIDKTSCNGLVNFDNGCILFNERSINGAQGLLSLSGGWDAAASTDGNPPSLCNGDNCSANQLIKVRPNRVCASWLDCLTYAVNPETQEKTCYALGICNQLNDKNECSNFLESDDVQLGSTNANIGKLTGYSVLDQYNLAAMKEVGLNTNAHYNFESATQALDCKSDNGGSCVFENNLSSDSIINSPDNAPTDYPAEGKTYLRVMAGQQISPHSINSPIIVQPGKDYYLNYLLNTKGSGYEAKISIYNSVNNSLIASATASSVNGWERKVFKFTIPTGVQSISIYLGANNVSIREERYVYFDDVNIEPVLQVKEGEYVAKECRLYPSQDAVSCTSKNSQVVSDGLVGYCLQHDPANKNVCLVWYPVDEISSAAKSGRSNLGYQGVFPLNYCTEANGNFTLTKKVVANVIHTSQDRSHNGDNGFIDSDKDSCAVKVDSFNCGDSENYQAFAINDKLKWNYETVYCAPKIGDNVLIAGPMIEIDNCGTEVLSWAWVKYNKINQLETLSCNYTGCNDACNDKCFSDDDGEVCLDACSPIDEMKNANPPIRVYDYDHPTVDEDQLKLISSSDPEDVFYPTCSQFVQVVDSAGNNKAWAGRTSKTSIYPFDTPLFFRDQTTYYGTNSAYNMTSYGRNRSLVPFGAATFPDDFNILASNPVKFLNQYSSNIDQNAFAGRPYDCSGAGCKNIGYCSLNPNVICLLDTTVSSSTSLVNQRSCGSINGTCVPMWNGDNIVNNNFFSSLNILKNIFNTSYGQFDYNSQMATYDNSANDPLYSGDYTPQTKCSTSNNHLSSSDDNYNTYYCSIWPRINNVKLDGFDMDGRNIANGIHVLTFNTIVDLEQQPLKDLIIDWGDGSVQNLVNQDHHPDINSPHRVYHYYANDVNNATIKIKATDNWGTFCCVKNNTPDCLSVSDCM